MGVKLTCAARVEEIMRRGAAAGQRRWRAFILQRRTGYSYDAVRQALIALQARGLIGRDGLDWKWLPKKK